ncbi:unnamed protein product [Parnassius apollo]|uniref:(apollo) hypothetical protein n=1 Tax=Parnassius apollo TaxID=110799 RepID=A0A8S3WIR2_PARAO|nr:unnamed protein product [Parnassius apollo]
MASAATKFVQIVEKYPCLYNNNLAEYSRKYLTEKAWSEVANEMQWTINDCKEKWKNIRNGFVRSLKPKASESATTRKKYYLHDKMQFILPYVKPVVHIEENGYLLNPELSPLNQEPASTEERDVDSNRNITEETNSETLSHVEKPSSSFQKQKKTN